METRLKKNCWNSAQLTTQKILKASHHCISYSRSLILPYLLLSKLTCYVTCALKGKDFLIKLRTTVWGPVLGRVKFSDILCSKKYFYPKIDCFLYFCYLRGYPSRGGGGGGGVLPYMGYIGMCRRIGYGF